MLTRRGFVVSCSSAALAAGCSRGVKISDTSSTVEPVAPTQCQVGENPMWHPDLKRLLFLDIPAGEVWEYDPATGRHRLFSQGPVTGTMLLNEDGSILLLQDGRASILSLDGRQRVVADGLCPGNERFNDGIVDPQGRVYGGAYGDNGQLIRFDLDGRRTVVAEGIAVPNGLGFTRDLTGLYFTDSVPRHIYLFDYDRATGNLSNRRIFATIPADEGVPDGMTVDAEGYVWTAVWFGGRIKRYAPDGRLDCEILLPVRQTSAVAFGGPRLDDLYVTSAASTGADSIAPPGHDFTQPRGGGLYRVRLSPTRFRGAPKFRARVRWPGM
jgi:D-xylono/L-arabinono-1,4-lactonase